MSTKRIPKDQSDREDGQNWLEALETETTEKGLPQDMPLDKVPGVKVEEQPPRKPPR